MKKTFLCLAAVVFAFSLLVCLAAVPACAQTETRDETVVNQVVYGGSGSSVLDRLVQPGCSPIKITCDDPDRILKGFPALKQDKGSDFVLFYDVVNDAGKIGKSARISIQVSVTGAYTRDYHITVTVIVSGSVQGGNVTQPPAYSGPTKPTERPAYSGPTKPTERPANSGPTQATEPPVSSDAKYTGKTGWVKNGNDWYYIRSDGSKATGWVKTNGKWYYLNSAGKRVTGWVQDGENRYYLDQNGIMLTGWQYIKTNMYYLEPETGAMVTGWVNTNDKWYWMDPETGKMTMGWIEVEEKRYYLDQNGIMFTGWLHDQSKWYYLDPETGAMVTGWQEIDGKQYQFGEDGVRK